MSKSTPTRGQQRPPHTEPSQAPAGEVATDAAVDGAGRATLTPERWVEAATAVLVDEGIDAVRVDVLAKRLGVTRGSFYWHFKDRSDLLHAVLEAWRAAATENLTHRLEVASSDPREQLRDVISLPYRGRSAQRAARIELSIRAWARRDDMARQAVEEADAARMGYIAQIFSGMGLNPIEARQRAAIAYCLDVAASLVVTAPTADRREAFQHYAEALLTLPALQR